MTCSCIPLAFGTVTFWDQEQKVNITRKIARRAIRVKDCQEHGVTDRRCQGRYLTRYVRV